jgi:hypothetical protein
MNFIKEVREGYKVLPPMDSKYVERDGLEGPFTTLSGKVVYYDPKEGKYYDPDTDIYMSYDEWNAHNSDQSGMTEWVQEPHEGQKWTGQERHFIQELCLRMDGISKTPNGLQWEGKSKTWDEGNVLSNKGKLTTVMLWAKKNTDDLYHKMGSEFKVYSDGNDEGDSGRGQSDGNQIIQNIIGKIGVRGITKGLASMEGVYAPSGRHTDVHGNTRDLEANERVLAHGGKGQYKAVSSDGVVRIMHIGKEIASGDFDSGADGWFVSREGDKGQKFFGNAQDMIDHFADEKITEDQAQADRYHNETLTKLANKLKDMHDTLQWTRDEPSSGNRGSTIDDILGEIKEVMSELIHLKGVFPNKSYNPVHTEEGIMSTIGQGIDNVAVGAGKLAKKGAKKAAPHIKKAAKDLGKAGADATKKGLKKLSKIGSKNTSYNVKTGKTNTTYGMANATNESVAADIKDYIDDHKEHFDAYPQDVEVDDKVYDWDEYWAILDKVYPDAYDNQYANESTGDADIEKMQDAYKYNEDRNAHSENILMLAHSFATRGEIKAIEGLLKITKQQGYVTPEQSKVMYNSIHKKYIGELFPIEESKKRMHISPDIAKAHTLKHTFSPIDKEKYEPRDGLEGPIMTKAGKVLYYDNVEGAYLDPDTDIYLSHEEWKNLSESEYIDHFDSMAAEIQKEGILHYSDAKGTPKYSEGYKAAKDGVKYDENPYSGAEKLQWSKGHNDWRADELASKGEPNYGARGQFESK